MFRIPKIYFAIVVAMTCVSGLKASELLRQEDDINELLQDVALLKQKVDAAEGWLRDGHHKVAKGRAESIANWFLNEKTDELNFLEYNQQFNRCVSLMFSCDRTLVRSRLVGRSFGSFLTECSRESSSNKFTKLSVDPKVVDSIKAIKRGLANCSSQALVEVRQILATGTTNVDRHFGQGQYFSASVAAGNAVGDIKKLVEKYNLTLKGQDAKMYWKLCQKESEADASQGLPRRNRSYLKYDPSGTRARNTEFSRLGRSFL